LGWALLLATCAHEPPVGTPGVGCMVASCCHGWLWMWMACMPAQEPYCGCTCKESPRPYGSKEQCLADHPETSHLFDAVPSP